MSAAQPVLYGQPRLVLVTRPEAEARETGLLLEDLGWRPLPAPSLSIVTRPLRLRAGVRPQAVLVTSGNALPGLPASLRDVPLLAVGDATAARAAAAGFRQVGSAGRDAAALAALVGERCDPSGAPLLLACGEGQGAALQHALRARGFRVARRVAYAARPVRSLPAPARDALAEGRVAAALFFSPAGARAFGAALRRAGQVAALHPVTAAAISPATAAALAPLPWRDIRVASRPNQDELLACLS